VNNIKIGSWVYSLLTADRLSGIERTALEIHACFIRLLRSESLLLGVLPTGAKIPDKFPIYEEIREDKILQSKHGQLGEIDVLWLNSLNPTGFLEILEERKRGLKVVSLVHDLLPLKYPEWFDKESIKYFKLWLMMVLKISDVLIFTSNIQLDEFKMRNFNFKGRVEVIGLGASIKGPVLPSRTRGSLALLAVSTIEPRKGYQDILEAYDILNALGYPVTLDIVGRYGWEQEELMGRILNHPELGRSLTWHNDCSDLQLTEIYRRTSITIMASFDEGWGLSLEEGLRHGHKIVARDIPIFRQRENTNIFLFNEVNPLIEQILKASKEPFKPLASRRTMQNFTEQLLEIIGDLS